MDTEMSNTLQEAGMVPSQHQPNTHEEEPDFSFTDAFFEENAEVAEEEEFTSEPFEDGEEEEEPDFSFTDDFFKDEPNVLEKAQMHLENPDRELGKELSLLDSVQEMWDQTVEYLKNEVQTGWEQSVPGMMYRGAAPDVPYEEGTWYKHIPAGIITGTLDLPYFLGGSAVGAATSGGNPLAMGAGAFAAPGIMRKAYMDYLEKGEVKDATDFAYRVGGALKAGAEEGLVGALTVGSGGMAGPVWKPAAELTAMTLASSLAHQKMPTLQDFGANAAIITGLHFSHPATLVQAGAKGKQKAGAYMKTKGQKRVQKRVEENLKKLYRETGVHPEKVIEAMAEDPGIAYDLMTRKNKIPRAYKDLKAHEFKPEDVTNLETAVNKGLLDGTEIWKYTRKVFDELHRDGKDHRSFIAQAKHEIGKKVIEQLGTEDFQKIADYYVEKYKLPVPIKVTEQLIPAENGGITLGSTFVPDGVSPKSMAKRGLSDAVEPASITINTLTAKKYGIEGAVATLRHEIEHLLDFHKGFQGTQSAEWKTMDDPGLQQSKTPADLIRTATDDTVGRHHKVYDNFELDYLHRAMVRDALERGEKVPKEVLYDYPDIQEYTKVKAEQKIVFEPGVDDKAPVNYKDFSKKAMDTFYEWAIDDLNPLKVMEASLYGSKAALDKEASKSVYKAARLMKGVVGKAKQYFELGGYDRVTLKNNSKAFKEILDQIKPEEHHDFVKWLVMQRAVELESLGKVSGLENVADKHSIVAEGKARGFEKVFKDLKDYQNSLLRQLVDAEIISEEAYQSMTTLHRHYVPFFREVAKLAHLKGHSSASMEVGTVLFKYEGSSKPVVNPLYSIIENTFNILRAAENNNVLLTLVREVGKVDKEGRYVQKLETPIKLERDGAPKEGESAKGFVIRLDGGEGKDFYGVIESDRPLMKGINKGKYKVKVKGETASRYVSKEAIKKWEGKKKKGTPVLSSSKVKNETMIDDVERLAERLNKSIEDLTPKDFVDGFTTLTVYEHGKAVNYRISEDIAMTMKNMDVKVGKLLKMFSGPAKLLRAGAILNPDFPISNMFKDQHDAFIQSKHGYIPYIDMVRGLFIRGKKGELYQKWLKSGGYNAVLVAMDKPYLGRRMYHELQSLPIHNKCDFSKNPLHYLRAMSELSEEGTRLGLFNKALKKKGVDVYDAAYESRDTTIDFSKAGLYGRKYNVITAFFNVAMQGNAKLFESLRHHPVRTLRRAFLSVTVPSIVNAIMNYNDPEYHNIPRWQRDLFWIVKVNGVYMRYPKPFVYGALFGTIPERMVELYLDSVKDQDHNALENLIESVMDAFEPPITPSVYAPFKDFGENEDAFTGQPLIPHDLEGILPELQYTQSTGPTARLISQAIQHVPGLSGHEWSSPIHVRHLIEKWVAGSGRYALSITDALLKKAGVQLDDFPIDAPSKKWYESMPILRAFIVRDNTSASAHVHRFFDNYEKYKKIGKSIDVETDRLNYSHVMDLMGESDFNTLQGSYDALLNMFKMIRTVESLPTLDGYDAQEMSDWKRQQIEDLYKSASLIAEEGNKLMKKVEEDMETRKDDWELLKKQIVH
jgi:hypothetical protein